MLIIHHIRNATLIIETKKEIILVDPMLGKKGSFTPFSFIRFKAQKNPIVSFPESSHEILNKVTHCLITHQHEDHIDKEGVRFLKDNNIPVSCSIKDEKYFIEKGLNVVNRIDYWKKIPFLDGNIEGIPAKHGYGFVSKLMGNVMGFYIELANQKSIYISSDTIYTDAVDKVLKQYQPEIAIVAAGKAQLDLFQPLLMKEEDIFKFVINAPKHVIANHLEAVNHCPVSRSELRKELDTRGLLDKVQIPKDGEVLIFD